MKRAILLFALFAGCLVPAYAASELTTTQSFTLHPGWNAVYIEVDPGTGDFPAIFAGVPVESVWTWVDRNSSVEFIQDPSEGLWGKAGWAAYFFSASENFLSNLHYMPANKAYLIKLSGDADAVWDVTGRPSPRPMKWTPDSFSLTGFRIDPGADEADIPTFEKFFAPSPAHKGQAMYRLNSLGRWEFLDDPSAAKVRPGEAYWVYSEGGSDYQGLLSVELKNAKGLDYGEGVDELVVKIINNDSVSRTVSVEQLASSNPVALAVKNFNTSSKEFEWTDIGSLGPITIGAGKSSTLNIAVRREALGADPAESLLKVSDGAGMRIFIPVTAKK